MSKSQLHIKKETRTQVFSCNFCEIFKNTFLIKELRRLLLQFLQSLHFLIYVPYIIPIYDLTYQDFMFSKFFFSSNIK